MWRYIAYMKTDGPSDSPMAMTSLYIFAVVVMSSVEEAHSKRSLTACHSHFSLNQIFFFDFSLKNNFASAILVKFQHVILILFSVDLIFKKYLGAFLRE